MRMALNSGCEVGDTGHFIGDILCSCLADGYCTAGVVSLTVRGWTRRASVRTQNTCIAKHPNSKIDDSQLSNKTRMNQPSSQLNIYSIRKIENLHRHWASC